MRTKLISDLPSYLVIIFPVQNLEVSKDRHISEAIDFAMIDLSTLNEIKCTGRLDELGFVVARLTEVEMARREAKRTRTIALI